MASPIVLYPLLVQVPRESYDRRNSRVTRSHAKWIRPSNIRIMERAVERG